MPALQAHHLLLDGELRPSPADRYVTNHVFQFEEAWTAVALWPEGGDKLLWRDGRSFRFDLVADPEELHPLPLGDDRGAEALEALVERVRAIDGSAIDDDTRELLEAAGYLEPDSP